MIVRAVLEASASASRTSGCSLTPSLMVNPGATQLTVTAWRASSSFEVACGVGHCDFHEPGAEDAVARMAGTDEEHDPAGLPRVTIHGTSVFGSVEISPALQETRASSQ